MKQQIVPSGSGKNYNWSRDHIYVKTTLDFSERRVTVVEDTLKPGFHLARHHHKQMTEIFYVLEGEVVFAFDDETVIAAPGITINIPPNVWHEVLCEQGGKLITIFSSGGFEDYLQALQDLTAKELSNAAHMNDLSERYDIWAR